MVTFSVGSADGATAYVSVMILNDDFVEGEETFDLFISSVSSSASANTGSPSSSTVSITDNDSELFFWVECNHCYVITYINVCVSFSCHGNNQ